MKFRKEDGFTAWISVDKTRGLQREWPIRCSSNWSNTREKPVGKEHLKKKRGNSWRKTFVTRFCARSSPKKHRSHTTIKHALFHVEILSTKPLDLNVNIFNLLEHRLNLLQLIKILDLKSLYRSYSSNLASCPAAIFLFNYTREKNVK